MANFTLSEPPAPTGDYQKDYPRLFDWCNELYHSLWLMSFEAVIKRKNEKEAKENEEAV